MSVQATNESDRSHVDALSRFGEAPRRVDALLALACIFLSGFVALLYQICWIRKATLVFGSASFAVSTVVAVFFGGMALGSYLFGRYSQRAARPLRTYAKLELALGGLGLASPLALSLADTGYGRLYPLLEHNFTLLSLVRSVLVAAVLLPPTILIGGTLPLFCRHFVRDAQRIGLSVGFLYAWNTLGAAVGCAVTGLWLVRDLGVNPSIGLGAALNVAIGVILWFHPAPAALPAAGSSAAQPSEPPRSRAPKGAHRDPFERGTARVPIVFALFFLTGFVALGNEILWMRYLSLLVRNSVYTYTVSLTIVLVGIVLGSALVAGVLDRMRRRALVLGLLLVVGGLLILAVLLAPPDAWRTALDPTSIAASLWVFVVVLLPPAILSGAAFPLAVRMVVTDPALAGAGIGELTAVNTLGGVLGSLGLGFLLLPLCGLHTSLLVITGSSLLIGFAAWALLEYRVRWWVRFVLIGCTALLWIAIVFTTRTRLPQDFLAQHGALIDFREGLGSNVAVVRSSNILRLEIDQLWQGQNRKNHQVMAAHIPMLLHPRAQQVAVIGLGAGQTCSRFLMYEIGRLDCVEIEARLIDLVRRHFDSGWMNDPRLRFIVEDARNYLTHTRTEYDLIAIEVGQVFRPGLASFYTLDFYEAARQRLKPGGILCQFVPLAAFQPEEFRTVVATFLQAFPNCTLWYNTSELLLVGTRGQNWQLPPEHLQRLRADGAPQRDMAFAHWGGPDRALNRPEVFLGGFLAGPAGLARIAAGAAPYRDDRPYLEYSTARYLERGEVPIIDLVREGLEPCSVVLSRPPETELAATAEAVRELNLRNVIAVAFERSALELPAHETAEQIKLLQTALQWNPENTQTNRLLGDALVLAGRTTEAILSYRAAVSIDPSNAIAQQHLGQALLALKQFAEAAKHLRICVELDPDNADAHNNLGIARASQNDLDGAIAHFTEALRLRPEDTSARANLDKAMAAQRQRRGKQSP